MSLRSSPNKQLNPYECVTGPLSNFIRRRPSRNLKRDRNPLPVNSRLSVARMFWREEVTVAFWRVLARFKTLEPVFRASQLILA